MSLSLFVSCGDNEDTKKNEKTTTGVDAEQEGITLDNTAGLIIAVGETKKLTAYNILTNSETLTVLWSSDDNSVATVDTKGNVTGVVDGSTTITATTIDGKHSASCPVTVSSVVSGVVLDKSALELEIGTSYALTATVLPEGISNNGVTWISSVESVATVSETGVVTAVGNGVTSIGAKTKDGEFTAFCTVTVVTPTTGVTMTSTTLKLSKGVSSALSCTVLPDDASNKNVIWRSSNESVATVNMNGIVTGVGAGSATITVETVNGGFTAECQVTVTSPVTGVSVNIPSLRLSVGNSEQLTAIISPIDADIKDVKWSTSNARVAAVGESTGIVKAVGSGNATITVTTVDGLYTATCEVSVYQPITSMSFESGSYEMKIGETLALILNKLPADADMETITFACSDGTIASVDENGVVEGIANGTVTITATSEYGVVAQCTVNVIDPAMLKVPVDSVVIGNDNIVSLHEGESVEILYTVLPENATNKECKITVSNDDVVKVIDGRIVAVANGTARVRVESIDDSGKYDEIVVNVTSLSDEEIQEKITEYQNAIKAENERHDAELSKLESDFRKKTTEYNAILENLDKSNENYNIERTKKAAQLAEYEANLLEATNAGNQELISEYANLVANTKDEIDDIDDAIEDNNLTRKTVAEELAALQSASSNSRTTENALHESNINSIEKQYEYIKKYIE